MKMLKELNRELRQTLIIITHHPEIAGYADRILLMRDGRILTATSPDNIRSALSEAYPGG
jgi:putative ABC transport system ATP-binding protein